MNNHTTGVFQQKYAKRPWPSWRLGNKKTGKKISLQVFHWNYSWLDLWETILNFTFTFLLHITYSKVNVHKAVMKLQLYCYFRSKRKEMKKKHHDLQDYFEIMTKEYFANWWGQFFVITSPEYSGGFLDNFHQIVHIEKTWIFHKNLKLVLYITQAKLNILSYCCQKLSLYGSYCMVRYCIATALLPQFVLLLKRYFLVGYFFRNSQKSSLVTVPGLQISQFHDSGWCITEKLQLKFTFEK